MRRSISLAALLLSATLSACGKHPGEPQNSAPQAQFLFTCSALRCDFNEASSDADGSIESWSWNFGDDVTSDEAEPSHEYPAAGDYTVSLTVTDNEGATSTKIKTVPAVDPVITSLACENGAAPGQFVACTLSLEAPAGFKVKLISADCRAHGNLFRITQPVQDTLVTDGCYATVGEEIIHTGPFPYTGPFPIGTQIAAEVKAPLLSNPPALHVSGAYPEWTLTYEDGDDEDFNDLVMVLTALP